MTALLGSGPGGRRFKSSLPDQYSLSEKLKRGSLCCGERRLRLVFFIVIIVRVVSWFGVAARSSRSACKSLGWSGWTTDFFLRNL